MVDILDFDNNIIPPDHNKFDFVDLLFLIVVIAIVCGIIQYCSAR